jgi:hypothetical protein
MAGSTGTSDGSTGMMNGPTGMSDGPTGRAALNEYRETAAAAAALCGKCEDAKYRDS